MSSARSWPENAATTPSEASAFETSTLVIRACAYGLRTSAIQIIPGRVRSSRYCAWPVRSSGSSLRRTGVPIVAVISDARGRLHGLDDVVVAGAAAEVALERQPDLGLARLRMLLQQADRRQHHSRRAVAALEGVLLVEGTLDGVQLAVGREPLDRGHLAAVGLDGEHRARLDRLPVEQHRARAAGRRVA